jgi:hypothetical protein
LFYQSRIGHHRVTSRLVQAMVEVYGLALAHPIAARFGTE